MLASMTWYITRASGVIAYVLLAGGTLWGLALSTKVHGRKPPRPWMLDVHRMLGALALILTIVHVTAILLDGFVDFGVMDVLVPFTISWEPLAVGAGIIAMYLLVAVEVTSLLRQRISNRTWRRVHYASFLLFVLASAHFVSAGTDAASPVIVGVIVLAVVTVFALTGYRIHKVIVATTTVPAPPTPDSRHAEGHMDSLSVPRTGRSASSARSAVPPPPRRRTANPVSSMAR
jgi:DMSO/TMAO reductase YedYZ heme-binding membrane subunit